MSRLANSASAGSRIARSGTAYFTIELEEAAHQALHGGGDWRLGRTWPEEWNRKLMSVLQQRERLLRRKLSVEEILAQARDLLQRRRIDQPFVPYKRGG
jgi:hypothetical protein